MGVGVRRGVLDLRCGMGVRMIMGMPVRRARVLVRVPNGVRMRMGVPVAVRGFVPVVVMIGLQVDIELRSADAGAESA